MEPYFFTHVQALVDEGIATYNKLCVRLFPPTRTTLTTWCCAAGMMRRTRTTKGCQGSQLRSGSRGRNGGIDLTAITRQLYTVPSDTCLSPALSDRAAYSRLHALRAFSFDETRLDDKTHGDGANRKGRTERTFRAGKCVHAAERAASAPRASRERVAERAASAPSLVRVHALLRPAAVTRAAVHV